VSYIKAEPHPGFKRSSPKQCFDHAEPVSKWKPGQDGGIGWYRLRKCKVCGYEMMDYSEMKPPEAE